MPPSVKHYATTLTSKADELLSNAWALEMDDLVSALNEIDSIQSSVNGNLTSEEAESFNKAMDTARVEILTLLRSIKVKDHDHRSFILTVNNAAKYLKGAAKVLLTLPPLLISILSNA